MSTPLADRDPITGYRIQQAPAGWLVTFDDGTLGGPYATHAAADRAALDHVTELLDGMEVEGAPVKAPSVSMLSGVVVPS